jgi:hypothetical protein
MGARVLINETRYYAESRTATERLSLAISVRLGAAQPEQE